MARRTRPDVGDFLRITHLWGKDLPAPVWGVVERRFGTEKPGLDIDVVIFHGREIAQLETGMSCDKSIPVDENDVFKVHTVNTIPQYALTVWTKYKLLTGD